MTYPALKLRGSFATGTYLLELHAGRIVEIAHDEERCKLAAILPPDAPGVAAFADLQPLAAAQGIALSHRTRADVKPGVRRRGADADIAGEIDKHVAGRTVAVGEVEAGPVRSIVDAPGDALAV